MLKHKKTRWNSLFVNMLVDICTQKPRPTYKMIASMMTNSELAKNNQIRFTVGSIAGKINRLREESPEFKTLITDDLHEPVN